MEPKLYVGTYKKYNEGSLAGAWLNLFDYSDKEAFLEACKELHKDEADPELMFQDQENVPNYSESFVDEKLWELQDLSESEWEAYREYADNLGGTELPDIDDFREHYQGEWNSMGDFAEHLADESGWLKAMQDAGINESYFDAQAFARDLEYGGDYWISRSGHVFSNY